MYSYESGRGEYKTFPSHHNLIFKHFNKPLIHLNISGETLSCIYSSRFINRYIPTSMWFIIEKSSSMTTVNPFFVFHGKLQQKIFIHSFNFIFLQLLVPNIRQKQTWITYSKQVLGFMLLAFSTLLDAMRLTGVLESPPLLIHSVTQTM